MLGRKTRQENYINFEMLYESVLDVLNAHTGAPNGNHNMIAHEIMELFKDAHAKERKFLIEKVLDMCGGYKSHA